MLPSWAWCACGGELLVKRLELVRLEFLRCSVGVGGEGEVVAGGLGLDVAATGIHGLGTQVMSWLALRADAVGRLDAA